MDQMPKRKAEGVRESSAKRTKASPSTQTYPATRSSDEVLQRMTSDQEAMAGTTERRERWQYSDRHPPRRQRHLGDMHQGQGGEVCWGDAGFVQRLCRAVIPVAIHQRTWCDHIDGRR